MILKIGYAYKLLKYNFLLIIILYQISKKTSKIYQLCENMHEIHCTYHKLFSFSIICIIHVFYSIYNATEIRNIKTKFQPFKRRHRINGGPIGLFEYD